MNISIAYSENMNKNTKILFCVVNNIPLLHLYLVNFMLFNTFCLIVKYNNIII